MKSEGVLVALAVVGVLGCTDERATTNPFAPTGEAPSSRSATTASASDALDAIARATDAAIDAVRQYEPPPPTPTSDGIVTDPAGDTRPHPDGPSPVPDLVSATVRLGINLHVTLRFAPGTFDPQTTAALMRVDADANRNTGFPIRGLGEELLIWLGADIYNPGRASVVERGTGAVRGSVPQTLSPDSVRVVIPRAILGPTAASILFRFEVHTRVASPGGGFGTDLHDLDEMPDLDLPPGRSGPVT